jgi:hypothetical protein
VICPTADDRDLVGFDEFDDRPLKIFINAT